MMIGWVDQLGVEVAGRSSSNLPVYSVRGGFAPLDFSRIDI